ncbi:MAG: hypothetical protein QGI46_05780 [Planctomycetota bacterium]|nr:hypothetical protein [Planctomycetota bacterium]
MKAAASSRPGEEEWRFGRVALTLGLVSLEGLQQALDAQEELRAAGIRTLLGDVMLDLELIDEEQCERALTRQDRLLHEAGLVGRVRGAPTVGWLVAGMVPALCHMPPSGVLAWSGAMLLGLAVSPPSALRWVGLGWITTIVAPLSSPIAIACSGAFLRGWRMNVGAALLGPAFVLVPFPAALHQAGALFLLAAVALALFGRNR